VAQKNKKYFNRAIFIMINDIKIAYKVPAITILASLIMCIVIGIISDNIAKHAIEKKIKDELNAILVSRKETLEAYFNSIHQDLLITAANHQAIEATKEFAQAWRALPSERPSLQSQKAYLQDQYIKQNPHPLGEKENLDYAPDGTQYSRIHAKHHPWFRQLQRARDYYDVFLFDLRGDLVYSVFKELDYATNLMNGEYKDTDLGNAFRAAAARDSKLGDAHFFDFRPYAPSSDAPASFISTPIFEDGRKIGVLVFQMPVARINQTLAGYEGLGETGQSYLTGSDKLMRSDSRFSEESTILSKTVSSSAVEDALAGNPGVKMTTSIQENQAFASYAPFDFLGVRWALITEQEEHEAMQSLYDMRNATLIASLVSVLAIGVLSTLASRTITSPIRRICGILVALSNGDDSVEITDTERKDEVGELASSALVFKENMAKAKRAEEAAKQADIRAEQEKKDTMNKLADDFESEVKGIVQMVAAAATQLSQTAEGVAVSIGKSTQTSSEAAVAAEQTSSNVQSVASAAEELSASVGEITAQVNRSAKLVTSSVAKTEAADAQAMSLSQATQRVKEVVELISDIAGKINLLSLNATIESARAGEAGKGFAVVASEVKNLANQTDRSIEEIVKVISDMNQASDDIITSLSDIKTSINDISESSSTVASAVEEQSATTNEIAQNMQTAAQGTDQIRDNIQMVSTGCMEADESARQILQAAQELSQQSESLNIKLDSFLMNLRQG
jgi:methyl-accepting chemotaxis protein